MSHVVFVGINDCPVENIEDNRGHEVEDDVYENYEEYYCDSSKSRRGKVLKKNRMDDEEYDLYRDY